MELLGMENLIAEVEKLGAAGDRIENKALREAGEVVRGAIEKEAPKRTVTLKESIKASIIQFALTRCLHSVYYIK
jgi:HK97 gp10 family phage protein